MKSKTKRHLSYLFYLGLVTAALSIGRAATVTEKTLTEDTTCTFPSPSASWSELPIILALLTLQTPGNMIPSFFFVMFESKMGMIFACGPALRQFLAYYHRTRSTLPSKSAQQYPNEDFEKMRFRVNLRDIFWYRKANMSGSRVIDARPIFWSKSKSPPDASSSDPATSSKVNHSVVDLWERRVKNLFGGSKQKLVSHTHDSRLSLALLSRLARLADYCADIFDWWKT